MGFTAPADAIERAARHLLGTDQTSLPRSWAAPNHNALLNVQFQRYFELGLADATFLSTSEGAQLEQECIRAVVRLAAPEIATRLCLPLHRRTSIVRRADDLMRVHLQKPVGAIDLCSELGVSDRTFRLAFREHFGLGPMTYYRRVRLNAVRAALRSAAAGTVAATARRFGFHHLGNFAADYRSLFGVRPSETLISNR